MQPGLRQRQAGLPSSHVTMLSATLSKRATLCING